MTLSDRHDRMTLCMESYNRWVDHEGTRTREWWRQRAEAALDDWWTACERELIKLGCLRRRCRS